jgi:ribosome-associated toxin RatA of RatAB toxin-antitoxin module
MAEQTQGSITIDASPEDIMSVIADFEAYPEWADVASASVRERDETGRATKVAFEVAVPMLGDARYTLEYAYADDDAGISWTTAEIDGAISDIQGEYLLEELDEDETEVSYRLRVDLAMPVPGFLRKQGEKRVVKTALEGLKQRVEAREDPSAGYDKGP